MTIAVLIALSLVVFFNGRLSDRRLSPDQMQNLEIAYHTAKYGEISITNRRHENQRSLHRLEETTERFATNIREPLPILAQALFLRISGILQQHKTFDSLLKPPIIRGLKTINLFWLFVCILGVYFIVYTMLEEFSFRIMAATGALFVTPFLCDSFLYFDTLLTELQAAALLTWFTFFLVQALKHKTTSYFSLSGVVLGLIALTKAIFLYVGILVILGLILNEWRKTSFKSYRQLYSFLLFASTFCLTISPWMIRNYIVLNTLNIAGRGPQVLYVRARLNEMTPDEYRGSFFAYSPKAIRARLSQFTDYEESDIAAGGQLQRLNRDANLMHDSSARNSMDAERAISYYFQATTQLKTMKVTTSDTVRMILNDIGSHIKTTPVFLWRGIWGTLPPIPALLSAGLLFSVFIYSVLYRDDVMLALTLPTVCCFALYAGLSHFIPRYSGPLGPVMIAMCFAVAGQVIHNLSRCNWRIWPRYRS